MKRSLGKIIAVTMVLIMLLGTTAFAADSKLMELSIDSYKGNLTITNYKADLTDIKTNGINMTEYGGAPPAQFIVANAVAVSGSTTIKLNMAEAAYCSVNVCKLTDSGDGYYTYQYDAALPVKGTVEENLEIVYKYAPGASIEVNEPGLYIVDFTFATDSEITGDWAIIKVEKGASTTSTSATTAVKVNAAPTNSKVVVDGKTVTFESYNIGGNNYFKLRDIAYAVNGTAKQFGVDFNSSKKAISLTSNSGYTAVGGELAKGDGKAKTGIANTSPIYKDGAAMQLTAYNINGNNYFKLRDLAKAFDIGVTWNALANTVEINTATSYTE